MVVTLNAVPNVQCTKCCSIFQSAAGNKSCTSKFQVHACYDAGGLFFFFSASGLPQCCHEEMMRVLYPDVTGGSFSQRTLHEKRFPSTGTDAAQCAFFFLCCAVYFMLVHVILGFLKQSGMYVTKYAFGAERHKMTRDPILRSGISCVRGERTLEK